MADMLHTNLPIFSHFSLPLNLFPHTNSSFIRFAPLRRRFSLSSAVAKLSSDSSQFNIISRTELADGSVSFKFGDAGEISETLNKFDAGNDVELERESDENLGREADDVTDDVTDDESDHSKAENFVSYSAELKEDTDSVVDLQSDVQICENSVEDEHNSYLISTAGVEDLSNFDETQRKNRVGNGAVAIGDSSDGVMIEKAGELRKASEELSDEDDELKHGGDESSNIGVSVVVSLEDEVVKEEIGRDEIVEDEVLFSEGEIVKEEIRVRDEIMEDEIVTDNIVENETEEDKVVSLDDEVVEDETVKDQIVAGEILKGEIVEDLKDDIGKDKDQKVVSSVYEMVKDRVVKDEITDEDIVEDEFVNDKIVEDEIVEDGIMEDEIVKDEKVMEDEVVKDEKVMEDEIVKDEKVMEDEIVKDEKVMEDEVVKDEKVMEDEIVKDEEIMDDQEIVEDEIVEDKDQKVVSLDFEIMEDEIVGEEIVEDETVKDAIVKGEIEDNMEVSLKDVTEHNMVISLEDVTEKASVFAESHPMSVYEDDDSLELLSKKLEAEPILDEETSFVSLDDDVVLGSSLDSNKAPSISQPYDDQLCNDSSNTSGPDPETSGIASAEVSINSKQISTVANSMTAVAASPPDTSEVHGVTTQTIAQPDNDITDTSVAAGPVTSEIASQETDLVSLNEVETSSPAFTISSAVASLAHSSEALTGAKDAHFVSNNWFGVADGVGQWSLGGVAMGMYAHEFMLNCERLIKNSAGLTNVKELLQQSAAMAQSTGSARVLIAHVANEVLHVANIGDSGFVLIRNGTVFQKSSPMVHEFSFPYAIGLGDDLVEDAEEYHIDLEDGDVIVTATDGLFDNLYEQEIASMVSRAVEVGMSLQNLAELLASKAEEVGRSDTARSPFADAVQAAGHSGYSGGKLDHVTVIVSLLQRR
ncbi:probable protein phosphatase 2C 62 isoform X2 [Spinacia oleracea]|uniref:Probable protein phosphatase 2C 62 isoform X1 n=1 Tax=Spinacia oleracea TaxID=3562 RepID=A0A9R0HX28_SPIOL|nr:probable protein phosphatase 2C 62 isoform X2 [Spinacia oleracea]XP_021838414.1 probable protein phosphatase 2C 62 isoform X2 [Spinacia oleracea]XP_021838416.1 probable protein phosphatase 2C 62 isoform X2 [Spinacia oleracea]XP_056693151.1 probable protein phosphatase 2C 62 isoform X2 [Spinacia oleracea]